jgi:hypothetical protein
VAFDFLAHRGGPCRGETTSGRYRSNGYVLSPTITTS